MYMVDRNIIANLNNNLELQIDECEWIQCVDPPLPAGMNLKNDFDGITPYEFGQNATYTCASQDMYFEEDKNMESFTVECLIGGRWIYPNPSPKCVQSKGRSQFEINFVSMCL